MNPLFTCLLAVWPTLSLCSFGDPPACLPASVLTHSQHDSRNLPAQQQAGGPSAQPCSWECHHAL